MQVQAITQDNNETKRSCYEIFKDIQELEDSKKMRYIGNIVLFTHYNAYKSELDEINLKIKYLKFEMGDCK